MYYYEVLVTQEYTARESVFTYACDQLLQPFQYVLVPIQRKTATGIIVKNAPKPTFATKQIARVYPFILGAPQRKLIRFIKDYYGATEAQALPLFMPAYLPTIDKLLVANKDPKPKQKPVAQTQPPLTADQTSALEQLAKYPDQTVLLHGETGTGKTRVYTDRANQVLQSGKSVVVLAPEIALIPQLVAAFTAACDVPVHIYHSARTNTQRAAAWLATTGDEPCVIIGTRSALFLPLHNIGLVIIDESHEPAYKQEEGVRYHASRIASILCSSTGAQLILGSATPLVSDIYLAKTRGKQIIHMQQQAIQSYHSSQVVVVDMTKREDFSLHPMLSSTLLQACDEALARGEQILIYLNRRGTARIVVCQTCGWQAMCPRCDISLTYHHDSHSLRCHTCGFYDAIPNKCPTCASTDILFKSEGTKALAAWLQKRYAQSVVARFDTDNTKAESLSERHADVASGTVDILVGTQMLVKGLDLPKLSVVGIVAADLSLQIPDFSAEERTYQLLRQAIGRVGRGHRAGTTVIQTFQPNNNVIQQAIAKNYDDFYTTQIQQRTLYDFAPITFMASLWISKKTVASALEQANKVFTLISKNTQNCTLLGPILSFHPKKHSNQTAQIVVKTKHRADLSEIIKLLPSGWQYDLEPINLL